MTIFCQDNNHREIELLKDESSRELKEVLAVQAELMKRKVCSSVEMQPNATNSKKTTRFNSKNYWKHFNYKVKNFRKGYNTPKRKLFANRNKYFTFRALPTTTNNKESGWANSSRHKTASTTNWESNAPTKRRPSMAWPPKNQRGITLVQVRTIYKLNEEKAWIQSGRCRQIKSGYWRSRRESARHAVKASVIKSNAQFKKVANL